MLHLAAPTRDDWLSEALANLDEILVDHAHCEKKAASAAMALIFKHPDHGAMLRPLARLAREELDHFEQVLDLLDARGVVFCRQRPSPYAAQLHGAVRPGRAHGLLDVLLCCALIEARSCERMKLLADGLDGLDDPALAGFYRGLLACEARHHMTYVDLALGIYDADEVWPRLAVLAEHEAAVLSVRQEPVRMHS